MEVIDKMAEEMHEMNFRYAGVVRYEMSLGNQPPTFHDFIKTGYNDEYKKKVLLFLADEDSEIMYNIFSGAMEVLTETEEE